jgi:hypothetical protein
MPKIDMPQALVAVALIAGVVLVMLFAPSSMHAPLAALVTGAAALLRSPVSRP